MPSQASGSILKRYKVQVTAFVDKNGQFLELKILTLLELVECRIFYKLSLFTKLKKTTKSIMSLDNGKNTIEQNSRVLRNYKL